MPLQLLHHTFDPTVSSERDVQAALEWGMSLSPLSLGRARYEESVRDLGDYFYYVGAVYPSYFRPLQYDIVSASDTQVANFNWPFVAWLYLLQDASDTCVDHLAHRLTEPSPVMRDTLEAMLASIGTASALEALANYARKSDRVAALEDMGFWIPEGCETAVPRFMSTRLAARVVRVEGGDAATYPNPIGLPLSAVMVDAAQDVITWHYCSLDLDGIPDLPAFPVSRVHLVSPPVDDNWTVFCQPLSDGRYAQAVVRGATDTDSETEQLFREEAKVGQGFGIGHLELLPYDDRLIYANCHVELTPGVVGDVGGPPIGLYPNPRCLSCQRLMFHMSTMTSNVREYGEGFRSLYLCETCGLVASHATSWN